MKIEEIKKNLEKELSERGLRLVWSPVRLGPGDLVVFGAEQSINSKDKPLVAGFGPGGFEESFGNSSTSDIGNYQNKFLEALEAVGVPRSSLHSNYPHVGSGKIWPTFVARLTQETFRELKNA
ncbi:MAG: hypothetical protein Q8L47_01970 [bacterium]|nr:hypothetical protein [bacterium]